MKNLKLFWLFYFILLGLCLQAQVNNQFKLQLYLADQNGNIYVNRNIGLKISILKSENDFPIYSERQVLTSDATGLLNIPIGAGTNRVGNVALFSQLSAGFIKIEYDPSGGSNYTKMLLQPLVSVPYASISNYALGLKGRGITGNHFADSSILAENLDFNPAKKEDVEILKSWIDIYTNGSIPTLITYSSSPNAIDTAQISAIVSSDGGDSISEKGFVYSLTPNPTINNFRLKAGRGNANFSGVLKGLNASSTYHIRSYAMNRLGIGYGNPIAITTASPLVLPTLITTSASSILTTSATTGGNVTSDGGATVTERGVVYATSGIPSLSNSKVVAGTSGTGTYTVNLTGLTSSTKYYFRAYATNSAGTGYGTLDSFVTLTPVVLPTLTTTSASSILETSATTGGNVTSDGGATVTERGVVYAISGIPSISDSKVVAGISGTGTYTVNLPGLTGSTKYFFRAYATNSAGTGYGTLDSFVTLTPVVLPIISTISASSILETSATTGGNVTSDGGAAITERGVVYAISGIPSLSNSKIVAGTSGTGTYSVNLTGLTGSTKYYFRAYATNSAGTGYGALDSFVTLTPVVLPTISTISAGSILETSAITGGNVTSDGGAAITERGVVYAISGLPSITDNKVVADTAGIDTFTVNLTGLTGSTKYYFRAYATNSAGTGYGSLDSFVTLTPVVLPIISTISASSILETSATTGGNVTSDGGATVTERGVVYATSGIPSLLNSKIVAGTSGTGTYSVNLPGLTGSTKYFFRAYATNSAGTGYGTLDSFVTLTPVVLPIISTISASSILETSATTGGNVTSDGGATVTERGVVYATSGIPFLLNSKIVAGTSGTGAFTVNLTGLTGSTKYFFRAYATNSAGTGYGTLDSFVTLTPVVLPTISTISASSILETSATTGGNVTSDGGATVTERGVVYATSGIPSLSDSKVVAGTSGTGTYTVNLTGLTGSTKYYFRAYATNSVGTGYGSLDSFLTLTPIVLPTISTISLSGITTSSAISGGNVTSDGGATVSERGVVWSTSSMPTITLSTKTIDGTGTGSFTSAITGIAPNTIYYVRAYATNSAGTVYGNELTFNAIQGVPCSGTPIVTDIDGNTYNTVQIGMQCWTKENLKVSKYNDGTLIPLDSSGGTSGNFQDETWFSRTTGARSIYEHSQTNFSNFGYLYNWYAAKGITSSGSTSYKNICPTGWHVPTDRGWDTLITFLGGENFAGGKMKSINSTLWESPNSGATDESGFSGLPAGYRDSDGSFRNIKYGAYFWNTIENSINEVYFRELGTNFNNIYNTSPWFNKTMGNSLRCVKDTILISSANVPTIISTPISSLTTSTAKSGITITDDGGASIAESGLVWSTSPNPTTSSSSKFGDRFGNSAFDYEIIGLTPNTTYYVRAYARNGAGVGYGNEVSFTTSIASQVVSCPDVPTVTDIDGNTYNTVKIGSQCWTKENLKVSKYNDGALIPLDTSGRTTGNWSGNTWLTWNIGARTIYEHSQANYSTYGYLYNWYAAKGIAIEGSTNYKNICPTGWHVPTDEEWDSLITYLGGTEIAGGKMKSSGTNLWNLQNIGGTNESGFNGIPGGDRQPFGRFVYLGSVGRWWSSSEYDNSFSASSVWLNNGLVSAYNFSIFKNHGYSVRCLRDTVSTPSTTLPTLTTTAADSIKSTTARSGGNITSDGGCTITSRGVVWSTSQNPTIALSTKTSDGTGTGSFSSNLTGLIANTTYYVRAYATNCVGTAYGSEVSFTTTAASQGVPCPGVPTVTDIDGNTYNTVQIGTQCWTKENLRVTKYSDGTFIPLDNSGGATGDGSGQTWSSWTTGARTIYAYSLSNLTTYGYLYNWYAAKGVATTGSTSYKNLCPAGWHVPSDGEWTALTTFLGGESIAGGKMKSTGTTLWAAPNAGATNESGFTVLPGGYRNLDGSFNDISTSTFFWSATVDTVYGSTSAWYRNLDTNNGVVGRHLYINFTNESFGAFVRCLRDSVSSPSKTLPTITTTTADSIKSTTARAGGNITSDGGATVTERGVVWSTSPTPTISLSTKSSIGTGTGSFTSHITGLRPNTTYYIRAYAINSAGTGYGNEVSFTTIQGLPCPGAPIVTDIDGNEYNTVSIGTQCWTKENIRVTKYNDGTAIPLDTSGGILGNGVGETWSSLTTGARSIYGHSENNIPSYGYLYNWFAATDAKGLCPSGWHLPTEAEWIELKNFLGGSIQAAYNMKDVGTTHWNDTDINVTNESGFTALAGGYRYPFDSGDSKGFRYFGTYAFYWSNVGYSYIGHGNTGVNINNNINGLDFGSGSLKKLGVSVRCLKDAISSNNSTLPTLTTIMVDSISSSTVRSGGNIVSDGGDSITIRGVVWSIKPNPTISALSKTWNGTGTGFFMSRITNLSPNTTYYLRAYAINNTGVSYGNELTFITSSVVNQGVPCSGLPTISDIDGNTYNTVAIGSQCWTRENLKVSRYNDGTIIPLDSSGGVLGDSTGHTWGARTTGARTVYGKDSFNLQTYGYLYNWYAAKGIYESDTSNLKNLCPTGWHVPTDGEWTLLSDYLGGESIAGNKLKTTGTAHWIFPNTGSTNESGFSALPGGFRTIWGFFAFLNDDTYFVSSSSYDSDFSWFRSLSNNSSYFGRHYTIGNTKKSVGFSVRCLKD